MSKFVELKFNLFTIAFFKIRFKWKLLYLLSLPFSVLTRRSLWMGKWFKTDNRLGSFLLPEYLIEIANLKKSMLSDKAYSLIDVGANVGQFRATFADFPFKKSISIEPNPIAFEILKENLRTTNTKFVKTGISDSLKSAKLFSITGKSAQGSVLLEKANENLSGETTEQIIKMATLDEVIAQNSIEYPVLLKIDVEGMELDVLKSLRSHSSLISVLQIEYDPKLNERLENFLSEIASVLKRKPAAIIDLEARKGDNPRNIILEF